MPLAVDVSNYTGPISPAQAQALRDAGVGRVVVQIVDPPPGYPPSVFRQQIPVLIDAGLEVETYVYLWLAGNTGQQVRDTITKVTPWRDRLSPRLWLDVEDVSVPEDQDANVRAVQTAVGACSMSPGVYTAGWYWRPYMGDTAAFAHLPLWVAQYDGEASFRFAPFGGWSACAMKQHIGESSLAGLSGLDQNWYTTALGQSPVTGADALQWLKAVSYGVGVERVEVTDARPSTKRAAWRHAEIEWLP